MIENGSTFGDICPKMVHKNCDEFQGVSLSRRTSQEVELQDKKYKYKTSCQKWPIFHRIWLRMI